MMRVFWRVCVVLLAALGAGWWTMHALVARAVARGTPEVAVRLGGAMAGLFVGGGVAVVVGLGLFLGSGKRGRGDTPGE